jgi:pimeloyl-ACP methyl ester carboxylesterase
MANFVLVHGAWHGGWCWRDTAAELRKAGHTVFTPTHTGVGERSHQSAENITLETHIRDVCGCLVAEELNDVVLVGHSYGGMVITGVADRMTKHIRSLVYLDAFVPENGDSLIDLVQRALPAEVAAQFVGSFRGSALEGPTGHSQPTPAPMYGSPENNPPRVARRCVPQALPTFEMPNLLAGDHALVKQRVNSLAYAWEPTPFRHFAQQVEGRDGWQVAKLPCSHDVMVDMPKELAALLLKLA